MMETRKQRDSSETDDTCERLLTDCAVPANDVESSVQNCNEPPNSRRQSRVSLNAERQRRKLETLSQRRQNRTVGPLAVPLTAKARATQKMPRYRVQARAPADSSDELDGHLVIYYPGHPFRDIA